jgi:glycosyltransferase involved in cell wall biosynthesis
MVFKLTVNKARGYIQLSSSAGLNAGGHHINPAHRILKIAVNSRMFLEKGTGVPNYINGLYRACLKRDGADQFVFFQPNQSRTIGETLTAPAPAGLAGAAWFDTVQSGRLVRQVKPDIFHGPSHILPWRKQRGVKYVVTVHDLGFRVLPQQYGWKHRWYYHLQVPRSIRMADMIVADSHNTKRDIIRLYQIPPERIEVVHLGVAEQFFAAAESPLARVLEERYFFSVTTHPKRKNILGVLRAFATFAHKTDAKYVVAGLMGESERQEFLTLADSLGVRDKVMLFGYASDSQLVSIYQNSECTAYPSFYEGFGLPVVEAMACGCPVIAANASSLPEILTDKEWLVDPHDIGDIAVKMQVALALSPEARREVGRKNQQRAREFTWEKAAARMMEIFQEVAGLR